MLASQNYAEAGLRLLGDTAALIGRFFRRRRVAVTICVAVVAVVTAVVLLLHFEHQTVTKVTGSLLVAAAAFGVSWSGARATLGKMLAKLEQPLWQIELDTAVVEAITLLSPKISLEINKATGLTAFRNDVVEYRDGGRRCGGAVAPRSRCHLRVKKAKTVPRIGGHTSDAQPMTTMTG